MTISIPKCSVLSISNSKTCVPRLYYISNTSLPQITTFNDLGILIDDKLTFSAHIRSSTKKAYSKSILLSRCFLSRNPKLLTAAFTSYAWPLLEYASPVWSPHLINPRTPRGGGYHPPPLAFFPYHFFGDSNWKNCFSVSDTRDRRHILAYVTSSWRCHVTYVMTSKVHDNRRKHRCFTIVR